jgi:subtilisin family serine protease
LGWAIGATLAVALSPLQAQPRAGGDGTEPAAILLMIRMAPPHARPDVDYGDGYAARPGQRARRRIAADIARAHGMRVVSQWPMPAIGVECFVIEVPPGRKVAAVVDAVSSDPRAAWAQPLQSFRAQSYDDPLFDQQPVAAAWQLQALHAATTGRGVVVAQVDSGAEADHPDLAGQVRVTHNTVERSRYRAEMHGTAVAGIVAARPGNGIGTVGVAPDAQLLALRACDERAPGTTLCDSLSLGKALQFALDRGARVVNISVSGPRDRLLAELLRAALARGTAVVAPVDAGAADGGFPASLAGVIAVAGPHGPVPAGFAGSPLAAPARDVPTTLPGARWGVVSGTSFAAAEVSGMVALLLQLQPHARADRLDALLRRPDGDPADVLLPAPLAIQACRSVSAAAGRCVCDCTAARGMSTVEPR